MAGKDLLLLATSVLRLIGYTQSQEGKQSDDFTKKRKVGGGDQQEMVGERKRTEAN